MKNRAYSTFSNNQKCEACFEPLMKEQFYLFPCSHGFHATCLLNQTIHLLSPLQLQTLQKLQDSIKALTARSKDSDMKSRAAIESLQQDVDGIIAADCSLCGNVMIESVNEPLVNDSERHMLSLWTL